MTNTKRKILWGCGCSIIALGCFFIMLVGFVFLWLCSLAPYAHRYIRNPPNESDLVGIWKSLDGTEVIELKADYKAIGTGQMLFERFNPSHYKDVWGEWKITKEQDWYVIYIHWKSKPGFQGFHSEVNICDEPPHMLLIMCGLDDDEGIALCLYREGDDKK